MNEWYLQSMQRHLMCELLTGLVIVEEGECLADLVDLLLAECARLLLSSCLDY